MEETKEKQKFCGNQIVLGCALYVSIAMGTMGIYITSVAELPSVYHISIALLGILGTVMSLTCMIGSILFVMIKKRIGAKGCLYLGAGVVFLQSIIVLILRNHIFSLLFTLFTCGLVSSLSAQTVMSSIISNWFVEKRSEKIAVMLGAAPFGSAFYQFMAGQIFARIDYFAGMFIMSVIDAFLMFFITKFIIIAAEPEIIGQSALGDKRYADVQKEGEKVSENVALKNSKNAKVQLYRMPCFWLLLLATIFAAGNTTYVQNYATMLFTKSGMGIHVAAFLLSCMSISAGIFSFCSGRILEKMRIKAFICILISAVVMANLGMALYCRINISGIVILVIILYGIGALVPTVANLISNVLFETGEAVNAASKCYAAYSGTNIMLSPVCAVIVDYLGFEAVYVFVAALCAFSLIFYLLAIRKAKLQN